MRRAARAGYATALVELLLQGSRRCLTRVRAPARWGKSTPLAEWYADDAGRRFAWLAPEREDSEERRFWLYVVEALSTLATDVGDASLPILRAPGVDIVSEVLPVLVNECRELTAA